MSALLTTLKSLTVFSSVQFCSVAQLCPTLCDPMDCSTPGFLTITNARSLLKLISIELVWWCHPTISSSVIPCLQSLPVSGSFLMSQFFASGGQSIGASASASVLQMNIRDGYPLGLTGLISLQSKGLWRVSSSTTIQKHQLFGIWPSLWSNSHTHSLILSYFGIGMKTDLFQSCGHCWVFQICWHIEHSTFTASSFRIWNSSTGIPTSPLASFIVMLSKAHLTSHSRMSGSRWVITP